MVGENKNSYTELTEFQEYFDGLVFRHAQLVIEPGGVLGAFLGPLPELARILARERDDVLLGEVAEDGVALLDDLVGRQASRCLRP